MSSRLTLLTLTVLCLLGLATPAVGQIQPINPEYQLKTAYLFHFAELAEWPESGDIDICLQGSTVMSHYLPALEGRKIASRTVHIRIIEPGSILGCRIVYLAADEAMTPELAKRAQNEHILLVGDGDYFARSGGMLQFTLLDNKLKLLVNLPIVKAAGLKLSSKLLRMADILE